MSIGLAVRINPFTLSIASDFRLEQHGDRPRGAGSSAVPYR
jgi:hypothetical protein